MMAISKEVYRNAPVDWRIASGNILPERIEISPEDSRCVRHQTIRKRLQTNFNIKSY